MPLVGFHCKRGFRTIDECLECPSRCIVPQPILELSHKNQRGYYAHRDREYHVTSLLGCPRKAVCNREYGEYVPPKNLWKMQIGTLAHDMMENNPVGKGIAEKLLQFTFYVDVDGNKEKCNVVGKFDWWDHNDNLIHDYKFISTTRYIPNEKHFKQMAVYYLLGTESGEFDDGEVLGGQIDYVDVANGNPYKYRSTGKPFLDRVELMRNKIPIMLAHFIRAEREAVLPDGDPGEDECNYCPKDFKAFCYQGGYAKVDTNDLNVVRIGIQAFRRDNTPEDED